MVEKRLQSGVLGLNEVLNGGYLSNRAYLVRGEPGTGKTTVGLHFLAAGAENGESSLFITLEEPVVQLQSAAQGLGLNLQTTKFLDLSPTTEFFAQVQTYDIFSPAEVEREPMTRAIVDQVESLKPQRIFIDSITQFRYFSTNAFQFRKQVLSFLRFLRESKATILFTSEDSQEAPDDDLQFMSDGVINLSLENHERFLCVSKFRGSDFRGGHHSIQLTQKGMVLFPKLVPNVYSHAFTIETISSGIPEIDELLNGGIERGSITVLTGPSGVGKSTLGCQFMKEAAGRGERSVIYSFEESRETLLQRSRGINIAVDVMLRQGTLSVVQIEPLRYSPDEFAYMVRQEVEQHNVQIVMIDSLSGYRLSVRGEDLLSNIHALCKYLQNMGVAVLLVNEVENITGDFHATEIGISYLADNIIFLRYLEIKGELRRAIGVLKKRMSNFEKSVREFEISRYGVKVGQPLNKLRGILSGMPEFIKDAD
ncbi:ATPase domain-containing protein [Halotia branconii]|uniref:non-specific serine/threonine protein kinase n=1 Tax=Halotia branconii CENA392 TaxID=1539056 RepID=A0AAJ6NXF6_9CYAN|nr:ATPase domain-containing protein [Halotia branconii]WGV28370.1 ATPase domain-containing protein [Halotia branconii CENA392]